MTDAAPSSDTDSSRLDADAILYLARDPRGHRFLLRLFGITGHLATSPSLEPQALAMLEGRRRVARDLLTLLDDHAPMLYSELMAEAAADEVTARQQREKAQQAAAAAEAAG